MILPLMNFKYTFVVKHKGVPVEPVERDLVLAARNGDGVAMKTLTERYYPRIYRMLAAMVRDDELALDLAQETFAKAIQAIAGFEMSSSFYTWLYRIARNTAVDNVRRMKNMSGGCEYDDAIDHPGDIGAGPVAPLEPSRAVGARELMRKVRLAMDELSIGQREILVLREIEGMSYEEIARVLEIRKGTVMSRLFAARMRLREILETRWGIRAGQGDVT